MSTVLYEHIHNYHHRNQQGDLFAQEPQQTPQLFSIWIDFKNWELASILGNDILIFPRGGAVALKSASVAAVPRGQLSQQMAIFTQRWRN